MVKKSSWLERKVLKPAKNLAIAGATALTFFGGIQEAQGQTHFYGEQNLNPFIQHNVLKGGKVHWDYYGSGDADGNDTLNYADYVAMQQGVSNDRTDVNGDEVTNSQDLTLISNFLNGTIKYLPAHWDLLQTRSERENWLNKTKTIDSTNFIVNSGWDCTERTNQTIINLDGVENLDSTVYNQNLHDFTKNSRFNIPTYFVHTHAAGGIPHDLNATFVGDSTHKFGDWQFFEPSNDQIIIPGISPWMDQNSFANLQKTMYLYSQILQTMNHSNSLVINFDLNNGNGTVVNSGTAVPTTRTLVPLQPTNETLPNDTTISLGQPTDTSNVNYVTNITPGADVHFTDSIVDFGNGNKDIYRTFDWKPFHHYIDSTAPTTQLKEYPWHWLNVDSLGTQTIHVVDDQAPNINVTSPVHQVPYGSSVPSPQFGTSDNSGLPVNVTYVGDSTTQKPNGCEQFNYEQWLKYQASDPAGNTTNITFKNAEIYKPDESIEFTKVNDTTVGKWFNVTPSNLEGMVLATDVLYPQNNINMSYDISLQNSTPTEEKYYVTATATGDCGCERDTSFTLTHDLVNSTNEYGKLDANLYPNPTNGIINLEGQVEGYKKLAWEVYDMQGRVVDMGEEKLFGDYNERIDISELKDGPYIFQMTTDDKTGTYKVVKE